MPSLVYILGHDTSHYDGLLPDFQKGDFHRKPAKRYHIQSQKGMQPFGNNLEHFQHLHHEHPAVMAEIRKKALQKRWQKETPAGTTTENPPSTTETPTGTTTESPTGTTTETPASRTAEKPQSPTATIKGRFITKEIDLPGEILVLYWLAKAAFPAYDATEGQWISDCIEQFYAEHATSEQGHNLQH